VDVVDEGLMTPSRWRWRIASHLPLLKDCGSNLARDLGSGQVFGVSFVVIDLKPHTDTKPMFLGHTEPEPNGLDRGVDAHAPTKQKGRNDGGDGEKKVGEVVHGHQSLRMF
jgi:hypothetical protein